jgi:hypothetical protein
MKTISLKMLLVAALVVSPAVVKAENQPATQQSSTVTSYLTKAGTAVTGVAGTVLAFPGQVWTEFSNASLLAKFTVLAATGYVGEKVYNYATTPKTKTAKNNNN